ncbi:MAG: SDR family oxidoreductase [Bacteroidota bacterium]
MKTPSISILGAGWLGLPLGSRLHEQGYQVKGSTTRAERVSLLQENGLEAYQLKADDQLQGDGWTDFLRSDVLFLNIPPGRRRPDVANAFPRQVRQIVETAKGVGVGKVMFVSSTSVYASEGQLAKEEDVLRPETASGIALKECESYLRNEASLEVLILRMAGLVGGDRKAGRFFAGRKDIPGGASPVNMVHRDDCIEIICRLLQGDQWGEVFNVCADEHPSRADFYKAQATKDGFEPPTFLPDQKAHKIVSNEKLKRFLSYQYQWPDPMHF